MRQIPGPSPALAEMLREDGTLDEILSGRGLTFDNPAAPVVQPPQPFRIPAWDEELEPEPEPEPEQPEAESEPQPEPEQPEEFRPDPPAWAGAKIDQAEPLAELEPLQPVKLPPPPWAEGEPESLGRRARRKAPRVRQKEQP